MSVSTVEDERFSKHCRFLGRAEIQQDPLGIQQDPLGRVDGYQGDGLGRAKGFKSLCACVDLCFLPIS